MSCKICIYINPTQLQLLFFKRSFFMILLPQSLIIDYI